MSVEKKLYRQTAYAHLIMKGNKTKTIGPKHPKQNKHSEDFIIDEMRKYAKDISIILLFTTNSPCLAREGRKPCARNLTDFSKKHQVPMKTFFIKPYYFIKNIDYLNNQHAGKPSWDPHYEYNLEYNLSEFKYKCKEIPEDQMEKVCNIIRNILSKYSELAQAYNKWKRTGTETSAELESSLREEMIGGAIR